MLLTGRRLDGIQGIPQNIKEGSLVPCLSDQTEDCVFFKLCRSVFIFKIAIENTASKAVYLYYKQIFM